MQDFQFSLVFPIMKAKAAAVTTAEFNPSLISFDHKRYIHLFPATSTSLCSLYSVFASLLTKGNQISSSFSSDPFYGYPRGICLMDFESEYLFS